MRTFLDSGWCARDLGNLAAHLSVAAANPYHRDGNSRNLRVCGVLCFRVVLCPHWAWDPDSKTVSSLPDILCFNCTLSKQDVSLPAPKYCVTVWWKREWLSSGIRFSELKKQTAKQSLDIKPFIYTRIPQLSKSCSKIRHETRLWTLAQSAKRDRCKE